MRRIFALIVVFAVSLIGCGVFEDESTLEIATDRTVYPRGTSINVTAKNNSSDVIYYNSCMPTVLEELSDGQVAVRTHLPNCDCLCTTELKPGEQWKWGLDVDWFWANDGMFEPNVGPRHQFRYAFYRDAKLTKLIRTDELTTNAFRFEHADPQVDAK